MLYGEHFGEPETATIEVQVKGKPFLRLARYSTTRRIIGEQEDGREGVNFPSRLQIAISTIRFKIMPLPRRRRGVRPIQLDGSAHYHWSWLLPWPCSMKHTQTYPNLRVTTIPRHNVAIACLPASLQLLLRTIYGRHSPTWRGRTEYTGRYSSRRCRYQQAHPYIRWVRVMENFSNL